jgi:hypothetical protein
MNIEELKLILDTIKSLSGDATTATYWYFGLEFAKFVLLLVGGLGVTCWVVHKICQANGVGADEAFMRECRDALGTGYCGSLIDEERTATQRAIRQLIQESKK